MEPWKQEEDRYEWRDEATGYPCLIVRNGYGALCGYVAVAPGHPLHKVEYMDPIMDIYVHGGLTYSGKCHGDICHVPGEGESDDVWWLGFDCNHMSDYAPGNFYSRVGPENYRTVDYVKEQIRSLAQQVAARAESLG